MRDTTSYVDLISGGMWTGISAHGEREMVRDEDGVGAKLLVSFDFGEIGIGINFRYEFFYPELHYALESKCTE
ncbi:hypothetical protein Trydic_g14294 [Trypoxylus dichotomus]